MATTEKLPLWRINRDPGLQSREAIDHEMAREYGEAMAAGDVFPAVVVYFDGHEHWLSQGFHRCLAAEFAGIEDIEAEIREGSREDAIVDAVASNREHDRVGLRRTNRDKRRAVQMILGVHPEWSNRRIAEHVGVSDMLVGTVRPQVQESCTSDRRVGLDDKFYKVQTGADAWMESPGRGGLTRGVHPLPIEPPATHPAPLAIAIKDADSWSAWIDGLAAFLGIPPEAALVRALGVFGRQTGYPLPPPSAC